MTLPENETPDELTDSQLDTLLEAVGVDLLRHVRATTSTRNVLLTLLTTAEQTRPTADDAAPGHPAAPRPQKPGPTTDLPLLPSQAEPRKDTEGEGATAAERFVQSIKPQTRIQLRVHPDVVAARHTLRQAQNLAIALTHAIDLTNDLIPARAPARALTRVLTLALECARDLAIAFTLALDPARALALDRLRALTLALARARDLTRDLTHNRAVTLTRDLTNDRAFVLTLVGTCLGDKVQPAIVTVLGRDDLPLLDEDTVSTLLDDFTTCDLRTADLTGIDLGGLRWTEKGTQWPAAVDVEDLKTRSEETPVGSGIYTIRSGTATARDLADFV